MTTLPPTSANPRPHLNPGYRTAALIVAAVLGVLVLGSLIGAQHGIAFASRELAGLLVIGLLGAGTWVLLRKYDHADAAVRQRHLQRAAALIGVALVGWLFIQTSVNHRNNLAGALAALPFMLLAIAVIRRLDRNEKEPWRLVLAAFLWGGVIANSMAFLVNSLFNALLLPQFFGAGVPLSNAFSAGLIEEVAKGTALVLLYLLKPDEFDDVVDGIVYGAMVGLGFNFVESIGYMARFGIGDQLMTREVWGLFASHAAYTALIGAGLGVARQQKTTTRRLLAAGSGFAVAIGAHFMWDAIQMSGAFPLRSDSTGVDVWVITPIETVLLSGPFVAMVGVLLYMGLKLEGAKLKEQLQAEAATGLGAVSPEEVETLIDPRGRLAARRRALRQGGQRAYRRVGRLQTAQLELAMERWHRAQQEIAEPLAAEEELRKKVMAVRAEFPAAAAAAPSP